MGATPRRPFVATYRLQLGPGFGFSEAEAQLPYLAALGVSHLYLSPILQAAEGSTHGYDVVDPTRVSEALGGEAGFASLVRAAHARGLGVVLDVVPNHMSVADAGNRWWWDVLEHGPSSRWAPAFDVDWQPPERRFHDVVLLPVLGDHRHRALERGELSLTRDGARFEVRYHDRRFPLAPRSVGGLLAQAAARVRAPRLAYLADAYAELPSPGATETAGVERRARDVEVLGELLALELRHPDVGGAVDAVLHDVGADAARLGALLDQQHYRLAYWKAAERDVDYRRFFDVSSLVGLRVEVPGVLEATHGRIRDWLESGHVDGVRVDHLDGLADPAGYLSRLRAFAPSAGVWVEKILAAEEPLPEWPCDGTTGYEVAADLVRVCLPPTARAPLEALVTRVCGPQPPFLERAVASKALVVGTSLRADLERLTHRVLAWCETRTELRDYGRHELRAAIAALAAGFDRYRTYVVPEAGIVSDADVRAVERAVATARTHDASLDGALLEALGEVLTLKRTGPQEADVVRRFQQLTPPVAAKGVEDTALYRDVTALALNDVGCSPDLFSLEAEVFHARQLEAQARWPRRLVALSTHDSKRSADVRARLVALAQSPETWATLVDVVLERLPSGVGEDRAMVLFTLQTLVGAWPLEEARLLAVLQKSAREAKQHTTWSEPNEAYEAALRVWGRFCLGDEVVRARLEATVRAVEPVARGLSLGWTLLQCTVPGVPDVYQGTELWQRTLVDPDNRRPVDFAARAAAVGAEVPEDDVLGVGKLALMRDALAVRRRRPAAFGGAGRYLPLEVRGEGASRALAFARLGAHGEGAVSVVTRWPGEGAATVWLPEGRWRPVAGGPFLQGQVALAEVLDGRPVALLESEAGAS